MEYLYCLEKEESWGELEQEEENETINVLESSVLLFKHELFCENDELVSLFSKEQETHMKIHVNCVESDPLLSLARREAVEWMLKVHAHYAFSTLTLILSVNYLDRFMGRFRFQRDKPWMTQLAAVACISLAAKVEETRVPLLLDLQVEESKYAFEAKTIQRMELLILSTLGWKMNPVTPFSFIHHIARRLGLKTHQHWKFLRISEQILLSIITDARFVGYLPSVIAASTMLHVINQLKLSDPCSSENQLLSFLNYGKDNLEDCLQLIDDQWVSSNRKRKNISRPASPNGVIDSCFICESSNDSWSPSLQPLFKKIRRQDDPLVLCSSLNRPLLDILGNP